MYIYMSPPKVSRAHARQEALFGTGKHGALDLALPPSRHAASFPAPSGPPGSTSMALRQGQQTSTTPLGVRQVSNS